MIPNYEVCGRLSDGLVRIFSTQYGRQLFDKSKLRKEKPCAVCGRTIAVKEYAWKEATQCAMNRWHRICTQCLA